jgi:hypothetical protein
MIIKFYQGGSIVLIQPLFILNLYDLQSSLLKTNIILPSDFARNGAKIVSRTLLKISLDTFYK